LEHSGERTAGAGDCDYYRSVPVTKYRVAIDRRL